MTVRVAPSIIGMKLVFDSPTGGVAHELDRIADDIVFDTKVALSLPYSGRRSRNPPPGPPQMRTGDLMNSVRHDGAHIEGGELTVLVTANAVHRGRYYVQILLGQGYEIFPDVSLFA